MASGSVPQMGDLVGGEVIEHEGRRHDQPPGEVEAPLAEQEPQRLLVSRTVMRSGVHPEGAGVALHPRREIALRLRGRENPRCGAPHGAVAGDRDDRFTLLVVGRGCRSPNVRPMNDPMRHAAQGHQGAGLEQDPGGNLGEAGGDPVAVGVGRRVSMGPPVRIIDRGLFSASMRAMAAITGTAGWQTAITLQIRPEGAEHVDQVIDVIVEVEAALQSDPASAQSVIIT